MRTTTGIRICAFPIIAALFQCLLSAAAAPIAIDTKNLRVSVDAAACRWSAEVKGSPMRLNNAYFLPGDDPAGWTVTSSVNKDDTNKLGSFVTVTLRGKKAGQLDFEYQISVSKTNTDILVSLGRSNNTGKAADIADMDYFVSGDARLGGSEERWISLGTRSRNRDYYELWSVMNLNTPRMYEVNQVVRDADSGNSLLIGHVSAFKGASRFEVSAGYGGKTPDRMQIRGYCNYKITIPSGKSFAGEKLLVYFSSDALRAMEHQADLIALAHDIRLRQRRPINIDDRDLVSNNYSRFHGWMSGGNNGSAQKFFEENGLVDFYWGMGVGGNASMGFYGSGGSTSARFPEFDMNSDWGKYLSISATPAGRARVGYPAEAFLPIRTVKYGGERVIDFSNPAVIKLERDRAFQAMTGREKETGRVETDFTDWWDKWPGQFDPFMSALETYRAGAMPWREAIDQNAPRKIIRSNMNVIDHSYGIVDVCRTSEDADGGYEMGDGWKHLLTNETLPGTAIRFFYSGRVFWNDPDGLHIYKFGTSFGSAGKFTYGQGKVNAVFHAMAGNAIYLSEALNEKYPDDRIELLKRISPPTMDVAYPVDLFVRKPAQVWNMPVDRPFGKWSVVAVFNYSNAMAASVNPPQFTTKLDAGTDLRLDPAKEYIVYEFWTKKLIGTFKGTFVTPGVKPYDCDVYSIVEKQNRPVLISTSRHVRQMAFDIKDLAYDGGQRVLRGVSRAVKGDPYQLRFYVPDGYTAKRVELSGGLTAKMAADGQLLTVDYTTSTGSDVEWKVYF